MFWFFFEKKMLPKNISPDLISPEERTLTSYFVSEPLIHRVSSDGLLRLLIEDALLCEAKRFYQETNDF